MQNRMIPRFLKVNKYIIIFKTARNECNLDKYRIMPVYGNVSLLGEKAAGIGECHVYDHVRFG